MEVASLEVLLIASSAGVTAAIAQANAEIEAFAKKKFGAPQIGPTKSGATPADIARELEALKKREEGIAAVSMARQIAIAQEGEAKRGALAVQGAQRRANIEQTENAKLEAQQRAHLSRLVQDKERAENLLAMRPKAQIVSATVTTVPNATPATVPGVNTPASVPQSSTGDSVASALSQAGDSLSIGATAPIVGGATLALNEGIKWESAFAGVKKQINASVASIRDLELELRAISSGKFAIPIDTTEIASIAENAGALGIAREGIVDFTRTMAMLGTTTDLSSEQAATGLAKISNVMQTAPGDISRFGSALVALGNDGASTESDILEMAQRIAGAGSQIGLSEAQVLGFASALSSAGINAEAGGSAISSIFVKIDAATRKGGDSLKAVADVAGMSGAAFKKAWQTDAAGAFNSLVVGLGKVKSAGGDTFAALKDLGISEIRQRDSMLRLAGSGDLLAKSLKTGESAWRDNTAMAVEAGKRYETTASQLQILQNRAKEVAIKASEAVLPGVNKELKEFSASIPERAQAVADSWEALGPSGKRALIGILAVTATAGPLLKMAGTVYGLVTSFQKLAIAAKATGVASAVAGALGSGGAAAGATGAGATGAGAVAAAPLLANPVTWVALAAAVTASATAYALYEEKLQGIKEAHNAVDANAKNLTRDLETLSGAASGTAKGRNAADKIAESIKGAGNDLNKLTQALDDVATAKREIKALKLSPAAEALALQQYDALATRLENRVVLVQVEMDEKSKTFWDQFKEDLERDGWVAPNTFSKGGNQDGKTPEQIAREKAGAREAMRQLAAIENGQGANLPGAPRRVTAEQVVQLQRVGNVDALRAAKSPAERGDILKDLQVATSTESTLKSISQYYDRLFKQEPGYIFNPLEGRKLAEVNGQLNRIAEKKKKAAQDAAKDAQLAKGRDASDRAADAKKAADAQKKIDGALAAQRRADTGENLQKQLGHWNAFSSAVDGVLSGLAQVAEQGSVVNEKTAKSKLAAQLARAEFDGIPKPLKQAAIELAGIQNQLQKIVGVRDDVRSVFNGIFEGLGGAQQAKFAAFAKRVEAELKLAEQAKTLTDRAKAPTALLQGNISAQSADLQSRIRANQLAGRMETSGAQSAVSGASGDDLVSAARALVGTTGADARASGKAHGLEWCVGFIQARREELGKAPLANGTLAVLGLRSWAKKEGRETIDPQVGDIFTRVVGKERHAAIVSKREGNTVTTIGGNEGGIQDNLKSKVVEGATYNINAPGVMFIRPDAAPSASANIAVLPGSSLPAPRGAKEPKPNADGLYPLPGGGATGDLETWRLLTDKQKPRALTGAAPVQSPRAAPRPKVQPKTQPVAPLSDLDGALLTSKPLPKAYGAPMADYNAKPGEQTEIRQKFERLVANLNSKGVKLSDELLHTLDKGGGEFDMSASIDAATQKSYEAMASMAREMRRAGHENNPYDALLESFESGEARFTKQPVKTQQAGLTLANMKADLQNSRKAGTQETDRAVRLGSENNGLLIAPDYNAGSYARAQEETRVRGEVWAAPDLVSMNRTAQTLRDQGNAHGALAIQKEVNATATIRLADAMRIYDANVLRDTLQGQADELKALNDEAEALQNLIKLRAQPGNSRGLAEDKAASDAAQKAAREKFKPLVDSGKITQAENDEMVRDVGETTFSNAQGKRSDSARVSLEDYNAAIKNTRALSAEKQRLQGSMSPDSPELQDEIALLEERARLLSSEFKDRTTRDAAGALVIPADVGAELEQRLSGKREEIEAARELSRIETQRQNVLTAQNAVLDARKEGELMLAKTARERLEIEWKFSDLASAKQGIEVTPEERAAREAQATAQTDNERQRQLLEKSDALKDSFSRAVEVGLRDPLKAIPSFIEDMAQQSRKALADSLGESLKDKFEHLFHKPKAAPAFEIPPAFATAGEPGADNPWIQGPLALGKIGGFAGPLASPFMSEKSLSVSEMLMKTTGGALIFNATNVTINAMQSTTNTANNITNAVNNYAGGGTGNGGFFSALLGGRKDTGGKAGTTPTVEQVVTSGAMLA